MTKGLGSANVFYCTFTKQQEYKKSVHRHFFLFVLEGVYANFYLTTAANNPSDEQGEGRREELEGLQSNFHKACLSAGKLEHITAEKPEET